MMNLYFNKKNKIINDLIINVIVSKYLYFRLYFRLCICLNKLSINRYLTNYMTILN